MAKFVPNIQEPLSLFSPWNYKSKIQTISTTFPLLQDWKTQGPLEELESQTQQKE